MAADFIACVVGGGLLGWFGWHVIDTWNHRPILYWDPRRERWVRCLIHPD